ncbi:hypothetical protein [Microbacterium sp. CFBP9034]|uniref:hypothetical protein n=1 Tax=Microbacterium sp. CFBP9034 TaxID=3096540 RepID=UPI002A6A357F|nr:hypothetical protein [Microbacterium sp. CFBP9034]MDY0910558.1 hypothetical protein [Microbacterium sp. CFBP9034]
MSQPITDEPIDAPTSRTRATAVSSRSGRVVFFVGGGLFILAGIVAILQTPLTPVFEWAYQWGGDAYSVYGQVMQQSGRALSAIAMIVFAVGTRGGGSVVARKPLGMVALVVFAVWPYVVELIWTLVPYESMAGLSWWAFAALSLVPVAAGLIAVVEIVRVRAVPGPWQWLPALAYLVVIGSVVFGSIAQELGWNNGEAYAPVVVVPYAISLFAAFIAPLVLGIAAVALALFAQRRQATVSAAESPAPIPPAP